jgi:dienelactone hydrolase
VDTWLSPARLGTKTAVAVALAAALVLPASGSGGSPFAYDASRPLDLRVKGVVEKTPVRVLDVSYASPRGGRIPGFLLEPPGGGRRPAVIYLHGDGGDRAELFPVAYALARRGAVTLAIDSPLARTPRPQIPRGAAGLAATRRLDEQTVIDLRRAVDVLRSRPDVDPARIGYVGFSAGARTGAVLAGAEHRISAVVLMSGGATPLSKYLAAAPKSLRAELRRQLGPVDPLRWIRQAAPSRLLLQDGRKDKVVPKSALLALAGAASRPKELRWYDAGHALNRKAVADQVAWLTRELRISK